LATRVPACTLRLESWQRCFNASGLVGRNASRVAIQEAVKGDVPNDYCHIHAMRGDGGGGHLQRLLCTIDQADLLSDERFASSARRSTHAAELNAIIEDWTRQRSKQMPGGQYRSRNGQPEAVYLERPHIGPPLATRLTLRSDPDRHDGRGAPGLLEGILRPPLAPIQSLMAESPVPTRTTRRRQFEHCGATA
jgi:hypothetical protein